MWVLSYWIMVSNSPSPFSLPTPHHNHGFLMWQNNYLNGHYRYHRALQPSSLGRRLGLCFGFQMAAIYFIRHSSIYSVVLLSWPKKMKRIPNRWSSESRAELVRAMPSRDRGRLTVNLLSMSRIVLCLPLLLVDAMTIPFWVIYLLQEGHFIRSK